MAYSFQAVDQALDSLGFSYVDGVTVKVAPKYCVNCDLEEVEEILKKPAPSVLAFDSNYDVSYERKVLEDLEARKQRDIQRKEERAKKIEEFDRRKAEEIEKLKKEAEQKALEDERLRLEEIERDKKAKYEEEQRLIEEEKRAIEEEAKRKKVEEEKRLEEEAVRKKQEEEAEWSRFEEERYKRDSVSCDKEEEEFKTPPQELENPFRLVTSINTLPTTVPPPVVSKSEIMVKGTQNKQQTLSKINFSDFEATSDPFADLELKSINDLAELQTILGGGGIVNPSFSQQQPHSTHISTQGTYQLVTSHMSPVNYHLSSSLASVAPSQALASRLAQTQSAAAGGHLQNGPGHAHHAGYNGYAGAGQFYYNQFQTPPVTNYQQHVVTNQAFTVYNQPGSEGRSKSSDRVRTEKLKDSSSETSAASNDGNVSNGDLKPSRSVGDMISELQREAEELQNQKKKSPSSRPTSRGATGLENWTPWPQLDQDPGHQTSSAHTPAEHESCLDHLRSEERDLCRQLHEMGFPLSRLAKGVSAVGPNSQKLINFCLVIDRLVDEGFNVDACEEVTMLHNAEEEVCRKHLRSFQQIAEIGFPNKDVHQALIAASFDHQKALDQLIR